LGRVKPAAGDLPFHFHGYQHLDDRRRHNGLIWGYSHLAPTRRVLRTECPYAASVREDLLDLLLHEWRLLSLGPPIAGDAAVTIVVSRRE
jgi:hypothetical protein